MHTDPKYGPKGVESGWYPEGLMPGYAVDGRVSNGNRANGFFHSDFEKYPWLAVSQNPSNGFEYCYRLNMVMTIMSRK